MLPSMSHQSKFLVTSSNWSLSKYPTRRTTNYLIILIKQRSGKVVYSTFRDFSSTFIVPLGQQRQSSIIKIWNRPHKTHTRSKRKNIKRIQVEGEEKLQFLFVFYSILLNFKYLFSHHFYLGSSNFY